MTEPNIELLNMDCLLYMKQCEDKQFDLAIVDPPYGIDIEKSQKTYNKNNTISNGGKWKDYKTKNWDLEIPNKDYFYELQRISKNQIVWGGNYFIKHLNNTKCFLVWDKIQRTYLSDGEMAWTSFDKPMKVFRYSKIDAYVNDCDIKIHPTQKPKKLYDWILDNYCNNGDKIIDTHLGSGSVALSCWDRKYDLVGLEIDKDYYTKASKRLENHKKQLTLF